MDASLKAQYMFQAVDLEVRPRSIAWLPLQQIIDELFPRWRCERPRLIVASISGHASLCVTVT